MNFSELTNRPPDFIIGPKESPYLERWCLLPRNEQFNVYLHKFNAQLATECALHDHPWNSFSLVLTGRMIEHTAGGQRELREGDFVERSANHAHRLELVEGPAYTLFITGPKVREWGFHRPNGWRHWKDFFDERDSGQIG